LNGEKSKFADVIAPYMLLQAKHTSDGVLRVNIEHELRKCCLLNDTVDDRVLHGVLAVWRGSFSFKGGKALDEVPQAYQNSTAYPENLVKYGTPVDPVSYGTIKSSSTVVSSDGGKELNLPRFRPNERVAFVLVSNAKEILLSPLGLKIRKNLLNNDLQLDTSKLSSGQNKKWKSILGRVKPGVSIGFLFTKSST
jgi:hypothetical protein